MTHFFSFFLNLKKKLLCYLFLSKSPAYSGSHEMGGTASNAFQTNCIPLGKVSLQDAAKLFKNLTLCKWMYNVLSNSLMVGYYLFNCPMAGQCMSNCPMIEQCISSCPKVVQCMSNSQLIKQYMSNCPMVGQHISDCSTL